jgi:NAD(P)-dependent dehydrogenase (short-subunit alcohol dehydrogenase family)
MPDKVPDAKTYAESAVVIAGGSSGIGLASALKFADVGVRRIALLSKDPVRGEHARATVLARVPEAKVIRLSFDAVVPASVEDAIGQAHEALGGIDVLVNSISAPAYRPELLHRTPTAELPAILAAQALPPMLLSRAVLPIMHAQRGGSIVNVASDAAKAATPGEAVLGAAMAAIVMFTRTLAIEGKRNGIRANVLTPSLITGTPTTARATSEGFSKKLFEKAATLADLGVPSAEDQAETVVFLAGPGAARLTGQAISVNGGISAF